MNEIEKWHRQLGAYGICLHERKLLVIKKGGGPYIGRFDLPGGTIEANETLSEAVRREINEEAGIEIHIQKNVGVCDFFVPFVLPKRGTTHIHHVAIFFLVQYIGGDLATNPEMFEGQDSLGALWIPISDFSTDNSSPLVLQAIDWLKTGELPLNVQRLDDWVVKELIN
jgi:ADP-ribose pyrophosphatase YjhB (NUDIX family)